MGLWNEGSEIEMLTPKKVFVDTIKTQLLLLSSGILSEAEVLQDYSRKSGSGATLGDIFKEQMSAQDE